MERVFSTIPSVLATTAADESTTQAMVLAAWKNVAGDTLNRQTRAVRLEKRKLTVAVNDAVWQRNLEDLAPGFIARINKVAGEGAVRFVEFVIDPISSDFTESRNSHDFQLSASLVDAAKSIRDEKLRENFLDTAGSYLARQEVCLSE